GVPADALRVSFDRDGRDGVAAAIPATSYYQMPGFGRDFGDYRDLGVLLLPAGSAGMLPAVQVAPAGYLETLKRSGELKFMLVDIVGYGVIPDWDSSGPTTFAFDGVRRSGTAVVNGLTNSQLRLNQNPNGIGTGSGVCKGDSGSPQLAAGTLLVLSVTTGGHGQCHASESNYRVDTPQARAFLGQFLRLPSPASSGSLGPRSATASDMPAGRNRNVRRWRSDAVQGQPHRRDGLTIPQRLAM